MTRHKWLKIGLPSTFERFIAQLCNSPLGQNTPFGFTLLMEEAERFRFRHLQRSRVAITVLDENGNSTRQLIDTIDSIEFEAFQTGEKIWVRVDDPPRSLREFTNSLEMMSGFGFSAEAITFPYQQQQALLQCADSCKLVAFKGLGNNISAKLIARIEVASKEGLQPEEIEFLKSLKYTIDHATFDVSFNMTKGQITFTSSGLVRINGALGPFLLDCVESYLALDINNLK